MTSKSIKNRRRPGNGRDCHFRRSYFLARILQIIWTSPTTLVGLCLAVLVSPFGLRWQIRRGVIECHGKGVRDWLLRPRWRAGRGFIAITFGDIILGVSAEALDAARDHEHVHVRQARWWGPLFIPAYLGASAAAWLRGLDPYRDNRFEREAYGQAEK